MEAPITEPQLRILLIDPHERVRMSLARNLLGDRRVTSVGDAATVREAASIIQAQPPDVVLVDPASRGQDWRDALCSLADLRRQHSWFLIALHIGHDEEIGIAEAQAAGCDIYLLKGLRTDRLLTLLAESVAAARAAL